MRVVCLWQAKAVSIEGHPDPVCNGLYTHDSTHEGWPIFKNASSGACCYHFMPKKNSLWFQIPDTPPFGIDNRANAWRRGYDASVRKDMWLLIPSGRIQAWDDRSQLDPSDFSVWNQMMHMAACDSGCAQIVATGGGALPPIGAHTWKCWVGAKWVARTLTVGLAPARRRLALH